MNFVILSNDTNITSTPTYMNRALSYKRFDVWHISNNIKCDLSMRLIGCFEDTDYGSGGTLSPDNLPSSYKAEMKVSYDLNWIADQDGNYDENCIRAFVKKINLVENFKYLDCLEDNINFGNFLIELTNGLSLMVDAPMLIDTIQDITQSIILNSGMVKNEILHSTMDINSGAIQRSKTIKTELFQYQMIPLDNKKQFLESYSIECSKDGSGLELSLNATVLTMELILDKIAQDAPKVNLSAICGDI